MTTYVYESIPRKAGEKPRYFEIKQSMNDEALKEFEEILARDPKNALALEGHEVPRGGQRHLRTLARVGREDDGPEAQLLEALKKPRIPGRQDPPAREQERQLARAGADVEHALSGLGVQRRHAGVAERPDAGKNRPNGLIVNYWLKTAPKEGEKLALEFLANGKVLRRFTNVKNATDEAEGYYLNMKYYFLGRRIRHCGYAEAWNLRLFKHRLGRYEKMPVRPGSIPVVKVDQETGVCAGIVGRR